MHGKFLIATGVLVGLIGGCAPKPVEAEPAGEAVRTRPMLTPVGFRIGVDNDYDAALQSATLAWFGAARAAPDEQNFSERVQATVLGPLSRAGRLAPGSPLPPQLIGEALLASATTAADVDRAEQSFRYALTNDPTWLPAEIGLAACARLRGDLPTAVTHLNRAAELQALWSTQLPAFGQAVRLENPANAPTPAEAALVESLAKALTFLDQFTGRLDGDTSALANQAPDIVRRQMIKALSIESARQSADAGDVGAAAAELDTLLSSMPNDRPARVLRAELFLRQGDPAKALDWIAGTLQRPTWAHDADANRIAAAAHLELLFATDDQRWASGAEPYWRTWRDQRPGDTAPTLMQAWFYVGVAESDGVTAEQRAAALEQATATIADLPAVLTAALRSEIKRLEGPGL